MSFKFAPMSKKQRQVLSWWLDNSPVKDSDGIIADGAIRTGKTLIMSLSFIMWSMSHYEEQNFGLCGKTIGSFRRNVLNVLKRVLPGRGYKITDKRSENLVIIRRGNVENYYYIFGGKDERSQDLIQGITLAGVFLDEVALMPRSFVEQACARCSVAGSKMWFNCNPEGPHHWFYKEYILKNKEKNFLRLPFRLEDNLSLSAVIIARYKAMYSGVFYRRFILGEWVTADGLIYDCFSDEHILGNLPETEGDYYVSSDYGIQNATTFLLWRKEKDAERWICLDEYYYSGRENGRQKTVDEFAADLKKMLGTIIPKQIIVDPSAAALIVQLKKLGYRVLQANNDVIDGIADVSILLNGKNLAFSNKCQHTIEEFGAYMWDPKAADRGADAPIKDNDHCMDAVRYFVKTKHLVKKLGEKHYNPIFM